jgi:hypothetical protein
MANIIRVFVLVSVVGLALGQLAPPQHVDDGRLYRLEAAQATAAEHIAAIEKLDLDRRMTKIEVKLESIDGWAKLIGTSCIGALLTWAASNFLKLVKNQKETT